MLWYLCFVVVVVVGYNVLYTYVHVCCIFHSQDMCVHMGIFLLIMCFEIFLSPMAHVVVFVLIVVVGTMYYTFVMYCLCM